MACEARQYSDQMQCGRCGLAWDMNDPEPPECRRQVDRRAVPDRRITRAAERIEPVLVERRFTPLVPVQMPAELIDTALAGEMARVYESHASNGDSPVEAMQAAYRVLMGAV